MTVDRIAPDGESPETRFRRLTTSKEDENGALDILPEEDSSDLPDGTGAWEETKPIEIKAQPINQSSSNLEDTSPITIKNTKNQNRTRERQESTLHSTSPIAYNSSSPNLKTTISNKEYTPKPVTNQSDPRQAAVTRATLVRKSTSGQNKVTKKRSKKGSQGLGCFLRSLLAGLFIIISILLCGVTFVFYQYYQIASALPDISDLRQRASQFETTRIMDRNGNVLYEILDPSAGRRTYVPLEDISPYLVAATVSTEDKGFYSHPGFDVTAIFRAFYQNYSSGETVSGASTITQQLARTLLFTPEERSEQTYQRKVREAILAAEITRRYSKDEILELYLNEIYYGNLAYGIEAAAETYFGTRADQLTLGQAAFLAGLPQAPSIYDVYTNPEATFKRLEDVLVLMYEASQEQGCIYVSNNPRRICLDPVAITKAAEEIKDYQFNSPNIQMRYPHWVNYVRSLLETQFDAQTIYRSGFTVYTTLDPGLQDAAQKVVQEQVKALKPHNANNAALVALHPSTGEILAMVGSADYYNEQISGQVNMAISPRQPGSAIKPLTYIGAFEKGWTPATLIWDVPSEFPPSGRSDDYRDPYVPVNYDGRFHGPVTVRSALANSYNIPAVKTLDFTGIYDDPNRAGDDGLLALAKRVGITTLNRSDYGLALTLGGGEVTLFELTSFYASLANNGLRIPPYAITKILDHSGNVVYEYSRPAGSQVVRPEHASLITSILSDNRARTPAFGSDSVLNLPFPAAVKTGTTNDFRDNWTLGFTPDVAIGVWLGNADYSPMRDISGVQGAAPIWATLMQTAVQQITGGNPSQFTRPGGIVEQVICDVSGTMPSQWCPKQKTELFAADQLPLPKEEDLWQKVEIDTWTGLRASAACPDFIEEQFVLNVQDPWARKWIKSNSEGMSWAEDMGFSKRITFSPERECRSDDPRPNISFVSPRENEVIIENPLGIYGIADATANFHGFQLDYGRGDDPVKWETLTRSRDPIKQPDLIYRWLLDDLKEGVVTLRLYMESSEDGFAEKRIHLNLRIPTPTPTPTFTLTSTPTPTLTPMPTNTPIPTSTPTYTLPPPPTETETPTPEFPIPPP